ncbi:MAG TPA: uroporphyrinogen-III synthase [Burkholderiaceae bacterium]
MTRVVLTQPRPRVDRLAARLAERGHDVVVLSFRRLLGMGESEQVREVFARVRDFRWVVFVSPGAIEAALPALPADWPPQVGIAVIGPGSLQALREAGIDPQRVRCVMPPAPPYDADALIGLPAFAAMRDGRILVVAGDRGRTDWMDALAARGVAVERACAYRNASCEPDADAIERVGAWAGDSAPAVFVFSSVDAVAALGQLQRASAWRDWALGQQALAPHPRIAHALLSAGWRNARVIEPGEQALCAALESR